MISGCTRWSTFTLGIVCWLSNDVSLLVFPSLPSSRLASGFPPPSPFARRLK